MQPKTAVPLTAQQQVLAAQWLPLARKVAARHGVDLGVALEGLCKAARGYKPEAGWTFQALATRCLTNACIDELRKKRHVELCPFDESIHDAAAGCTDILGERESIPQPIPAWTPPPDPVVRPPRPPGTSPRSVRRRAAAAGQARPVGRPAVLDGHALLRILQRDRHLSITALAEALGLHRRTLSRGKNGQLLARMRTLAQVRIFEHAATPDRAAATGQDPRPVPAAVWR